MSRDTACASICTGETLQTNYCAIHVLLSSSDGNLWCLCNLSVPELSSLSHAKRLPGSSAHAATLSLDSDGVTLAGHCAA